MELLLRRLAESFDLGWRVLNGQVIGSSSLRAVKGEISQKNSLEMSDLAVLRKEDRSGGQGLGHCGKGWKPPGRERLRTAAVHSFSDAEWSLVMVVGARLALCAVFAST